MAEQGHRKDRLAGAIRRHLSGELMRFVKDPRLASLCIENVVVSADLGLAKVGVRLMFGGEEQAARNAAMAAIQAVAPGLRSSLGPVLRLRRLPDLRFYYDDALDQRAEIDAVLNEIKREDAAKREAMSSTAEELASDGASAGDQPPPASDES